MVWRREAKDILSAGASALTLPGWNVLNANSCRDWALTGSVANCDKMTKWQNMVQLHSITQCLQTSHITKSCKMPQIKATIHKHPPRNAPKWHKGKKLWNNTFCSSLEICKSQRFRRCHLSPVGRGIFIFVWKTILENIFKWITFLQG